MLVLQSSPKLAFADCSPMVPFNALFCFPFLTENWQPDQGFVTLGCNLPP